LNKKHIRTYEAIFHDPVLSNINWKDIESMLKASGAKLTEGRGSRIRVKLNNIFATFHRPHPNKETDKGAVKQIRRFLINAGVEIC